MLGRDEKGRFDKGFIPWNKGKKGVMPAPWNKGLRGTYKCKPCSEERKKKISEALKGNQKCGLKTRYKKGHPQLNTGRTYFKKGRKLPEEHKRKISNRMKGNQHTKGMKHSEEARRKISKANKGKRVGKDNPTWRGGKSMKGGYVYLNSKKIFEHRYIMENFLKRKLNANEQVHHKNCVKTDNRIENLEVVISGFHYSEAICPHCQKSFKIK